MGLTMQGSKRLTNIPIEALRSVVCIADTGSLTKAASFLGLSQPALSAQLKRLEYLVGGAVFNKAAGGSVATDLGQIVILHSRRIMESNDQLLRLRGDSDVSKTVRLGLSNLCAEALFQRKAEIDLSRLTIVVDHPAALLSSLRTGFLDAALILGAGDTELDLSFRKLGGRDVPLVWARSRDFVLSPGAPIPVLKCPGQVTDELMIAALEDARMSYRIAFSSPDYHATLAAGRAGTGLSVFPADMPLPGLVHANEYYLPSLKPAKLMLCEGRDRAARQPELFRHLLDAFFGQDGRGDHTIRGSSAMHASRNGSAMSAAGG
jgi:DNA-binding transcriptional LysR family regulator